MKPASKLACGGLLGVSFVVAVPILIYVAYVAIAMASAPGDRISSEQIRQLSDGMTRDEVLAIMEKPNSRSENRLIYLCEYPDWLSDPVCIGFDENGRMNWFSQ